MRKYQYWLALLSLLTFSPTHGNSGRCTEYYVSPKGDLKKPNLVRIRYSTDEVQITHVELEKSTNGSDYEIQKKDGKQKPTITEEEPNDLIENPRPVGEFTLDVSKILTDQIDDAGKANANQRIERFSILGWIAQNWDSLLALVLAGGAVHYARNAWQAARDDVNESKKANVLQLKAYFSVTEAKTIVADTQETGDTDFEVPDLSEEEIEELIESAGVEHTSDDSSELLLDINAEQIDPHNMIFIHVRFKLTNTGATPAWNIQAFTVYDFSLKMLGVDLHPIFGGKPIIDGETNHLGPGDHMTVHVTCAAFGIPGTAINIDPSVIAEHIEFEFAAESSLDDIETRTDKNITRQISVVGSNGAPKIGDMAFDYPDMSGDDFGNNIESGYLPLTSIRVASDETGQKENRFTTENYKTYTPNENSDIVWVKKDGPEGYKGPE